MHFTRPEHIADLCRLVGGIGQPLSLLLKLNPLITELSLYDVVNAPGVSALLVHFRTEATKLAWRCQPR